MLLLLPFHKWAKELSIFLTGTKRHQNYRTLVNLSENNKITLSICKVSSININGPVVDAQTFRAYNLNVWDWAKKTNLFSIYVCTITLQVKFLLKESTRHKYCYPDLHKMEEKGERLTTKVIFFVSNTASCFNVLCVVVAWRRYIARRK